MYERNAYFKFKDVIRARVTLREFICIILRITCVLPDLNFNLNCKCSKLESATRGVYWQIRKITYNNTEKLKYIFEKILNCCYGFLVYLKKLLV